MIRTALRMLVAAAAVTLATVTASQLAIQDASADQTMSSSGPLSSIETTSDLNCAVNEVGDAHGEWFGDTACGTFLALGGAAYGPADVPAGPAFTTWKEVSQTPVSGTGTSSDPLSLTTDVAAGKTGVTLSQTDSYVVAQQSYRTDMTLTNSGTTSRKVILYKAGDCYFSDSDSGFARIDNGNTPDCVAPSFDDPTVPGPRIESLIPLTSGSTYQVGAYYPVWEQIAAGNAFANTCQCDVSQGSYDNGMGLSWTLSLPAGSSTTVSESTYFSPPPLVTTVSADSAAVVPGAPDGFSVTLSNPTALAVSVDSISDQLPNGFSYTSGSTTGGLTTDPTSSGATLTWNGPFSLPAGGNVTFHFDVTVSSNNEAGIDTATAAVSTPADQTVMPGTAEVDVAPVAVTAVSPATMAVGTSKLVSFTGTTFDPNGQIALSGTGVTISQFKVVSSTRAHAVLTVSSTAPTGPRDVTFTAQDGDSGTCAGCLTIDPLPSVSTLSPAVLGQGAASVPLTVMGSGFQKSAAVTSTRATVDHKTWVSSNEIDLVVSVPASAKVGQGTLTVTNGDGGAATATLTIDAKPVLTAGSPSVSPGSTQVVTVTGKQFVTGLSASTTAAGITLGSPQDVTATSFQLSVTASSSAKTGKDPLTVTNPDQGQATKNILIVAS